MSGPLGDLQGTSSGRRVPAGFVVVNVMLYPEPVVQKQSSRSSRVLQNFANFTGNQLCWSLSFNKVEGLRPPSNTGISL